MSLSFKLSPISLLTIIFSVHFASSEQFDDCGKRSFTQGLIVGGNEAVLGQFPWHAALILKGKTSQKYICGATIITKKHLLSAAHCFQPYKDARIKPPDSIKVLIGGLKLSNLNNTNWTGLNVKNIILHPDWGKKEKNRDADLAILELETPLTFNENVRRVCLPKSNQQNVVSNGTVVRYGLTEQGNTYSKSLKFIELATKNTLECVLQDKDFSSYVSGRMFCAGEPGKAVCEGDAGNSFVEVNEVKRFSIIGTVSTIMAKDGYCDLNVPAIFTSIPLFVDWILDNVKSELPDSDAKLDIIPSRCTDPVAAGTCNKQETKYYFDTNAKQCKGFIYSGCNGNENRFDSMLDCQNFCKSPQNNRRCKELADKCSAIRCRYGLIRSNDVESGCEKCECHNPCAYHSCPEGQRCIATENSEDDEEELTTQCVAIKKPGSCSTSFSENVKQNVYICGDDADCPGSYKCCEYENFSICRLPLFPVKINVFPSDNLNPSKKEHESVILKCRASGSPKPNITWTHNGVEVESKFGRFVAPSNGDLKMLDLKMADAGEYVCSVNNGVGESVKLEYTLTVHQDVNGEKKYQWQTNSPNSRISYTFLPFLDTIIDARTYEVASNKDKKVESFKASNISTISYLPVKVADVFPNLNFYFVKNCSVMEISKENFKGLRKLETLILETNKITSVDKDSFEDLVKLSALNLAENQITSLHEEMFNNNLKLEVLDLYGNELESLPSKLLQKLSNLEVIILGENNLKTLDVNFFLHNVKLTEIWLERNQIEHLNVDTFKGLRRLKYVNLSGNKCIDKKYGKILRANVEKFSKLSSDLAQSCSQRIA